jgi:hypothetical protein
MTEQPSAGPVSELVEVTLTNGVRTSAGVGPGTFRLPPGEAASLVGRKVAAYGGRPVLGTEQATRAVERYFGQEPSVRKPTGSPGHWVPREDGGWDPPWTEEAS